MDFKISFDEENFEEIKINFPSGDNEIVEMLLVTPLLNHFIEEVSRGEEEIIVKCKPGKGEDALCQMARNMYSVFKVCELPGKLEENLLKIPEYMEEVREKTWKELFDILENKD